jgi:chorismate mutase
MPIRGIRGATVAAANTAEAIRAATRELLGEVIAANALRADDIASVVFSVTPDLSAEAPARAAREMGWGEAAMLCLAEMPVPGGPERCIRALIHWNTDLPPSQVHHVYLHAAAQLRPDRASAANGRHGEG